MIWLALTLVVGLLVIVVIARPLLREPLPWDPEAQTRVHDLLSTQKEQALRKLKDLDFEREAGTIDAAEYETLRRSTLAEAALIEKRRRALERPEAEA